MITITIPGYPARELSPNARVHWSVRSRCAKAARTESCWEAREQAPYDVNQAQGAVSYLVFAGLPKGTKTPDKDNFKSMLKPYQDGLADHLSGGNDKHWVCDGVAFERDKTGPGWVKFVISWEDAE